MSEVPKTALCDEDREALIGRMGEMQAQLSVLGKVRPVVNMPTFRGKSDKMSWPMFVAEFNRAATANSWNDADCCQFLPCFLRGSALPAWEGLKPEVQENWQAVGTELSKIFALGEGAAELRRTVQNRKQRDGEEVDTFGEAIRKDVNKAFIDDHGYNEAMRENTKIDVLTAKVNQLELAPPPPVANNNYAPQRAQNQPRASNGPWQQRFQGGQNSRWNQNRGPPRAPRFNDTRRFPRENFQPPERRQAYLCGDGSSKLEVWVFGEGSSKEVKLGFDATRHNSQVQGFGV